MTMPAIPSLRAAAALQLVELLNYPQSVRRSRLISKPTNGVATLNTPVSPPVLAILGDESIQGDGVYALTNITNGVRAEKVLTNGLVITKDFVLGSNYLLTATVRVKNASKQQVTVPTQNWAVGTSTPMGPQDAGIADSIMWYNGAKPNSVLASYFNTNTTILGVFHHTVPTEYRAGSNNVVWVSAQNQFFSLVTMPASNQMAAAVVAHRGACCRPPSEEEIEASSRTCVLQPQGIEAMLVYPMPPFRPGTRKRRSISTSFSRDRRFLLDARGPGLASWTTMWIWVMGFGFWG